MSTISIRNVSSWYGQKKVLDNVNMEIMENEITAFIGPSACGKTTLLKSINRMNDLIKDFKIEGSIVIEDIDIYKDIIKPVDVMKLRQKIGMVFQSPNPFPMSIIKNLTLPIEETINDLSDKEVEEIAINSLKSVHLYNEIEDRLTKSALNISGGQQQRLSIARCLTISPSIILFDEPCSALDPISTILIEELLLELKEKYTIVIVTHNMQQARRISDKVGFFYQGELVEFGDSNEFFGSPKEELTQNYLRGVF